MKLTFITASRIILPKGRFDIIKSENCELSQDSVQWWTFINTSYADEHPGSIKAANITTSKGRPFNMEEVFLDQLGSQ
jgi:hypothetical protein